MKRSVYNCLKHPEARQYKDGSCYHCRTDIYTHSPRGQKVMKKRVVFIKRFAQWLKDNIPCANCRHFYDSRVMQFDHIDPKTKRWCAATKGNSLQSYIEEVIKTRLLCANCHSIKTVEQLTHRWKLNKAI